jgi:hypothetical protein
LTSLSINEDDVEVKDIIDELERKDREEAQQTQS